jgi:hypothetical protein
MGYYSRFLRRSAASLFLVMASTSLQTRPQAQESVNQIQQFPGIGAALEALGSKFGVRTGLELVRSDTDDVPISVNLSGTDVAELLNKLVQQRPTYTWTLYGGVYDVYPKTEGEKISDLRIRIYSIRNASVEEASLAISDSPDFKRWLTQRHIARREIGNGRLSSKPKISMALENAPLRTILNELAAC